MEEKRGKAELRKRESLNASALAAALPWFRSPIAEYGVGARNSGGAPGRWGKQRIKALFQGIYKTLRQF
jgi:hypothetical protein